MLRGMTIKDAKKALESMNLSIKLNVDTEDGIDKSVTKIKEQTPKKGIKLEAGSFIMCDI